MNVWRTQPVTCDETWVFQLWWDLGIPVRPRNRMSKFPMRMSSLQDWQKHECQNQKPEPCWYTFSVPEELRTNSIHKNSQLRINFWNVYSITYVIKTKYLIGQVDFVSQHCTFLNNTFSKVICNCWTHYTNHTQTCNFIWDISAIILYIEI
jgi:hypothetical protein